MVSLENSKRGLCIVRLARTSRGCRRISDRTLNLHPETQVTFAVILGRRTRPCLNPRRAARPERCVPSALPALICLSPQTRIPHPATSEKFLQARPSLVETAFVRQQARSVWGRFSRSQSHRSAFHARLQECHPRFAGYKRGERCSSTICLVS